MREGSPVTRRNELSLIIDNVSFEFLNEWVQNELNKYENKRKE
jgi:hypothetical protein